MAQSHVLADHDELVQLIFDSCDDDTKTRKLRGLSKAYRARFAECTVMRGPEPPPREVFARWVRANQSIPQHIVRIMLSEYPSWMMRMAVLETPTDSNRHTILCELARAGRLEDIQWARSQPQPCPWDAETYYAAAENGHLEVLQWLGSQPEPCPWNAWTCRVAARNGHLEVLQWLRSQPEPCPWDTSASQAAAENGHMEVLQWLLDNGCSL